MRVKLSDEELLARRSKWRPTSRQLVGALEKYERLVGPANEGAVTYRGFLEWPYE